MAQIIGLYKARRLRYTPQRGQVAALVAVLKAARSVGLAEDLAAVQVPGGGAPIAIPAAMLRTAVAHRSESLRVDALQLACSHPKTSSLPGAPQRKCDKA